MAQQKRNGRGNGSNERKTPNQSAQPRLGWVAAGLVILIVVVAVAMGLERSNQRGELGAEVNMTPIVGGMAVATAAVDAQDGASDAAAVGGEPDVTNMVTVTLPVTSTEGVTRSAVTTTTVISDGMAVTGTSGLTETTGLTGTDGLTETAVVTDATALTETTVVSATGQTTGTADATAGAAITDSESLTQSAESATPEPKPTATRTPRPTPSPTPTRSGPPPSFEVGDSVVNEQDEVALHADTTPDSLVLDTINAGVAMTVIEPSGADVSYPVENEGYGWVRVRSADGLVGWAITDGLSRVP